MASLFEEFGIPIPGGKVEPPVSQQAFAVVDPLAEIEAMGRGTPWWEKFVPLCDPRELSHGYLSRMLEVSKRRGTVAYICARCSKAIPDTESLHVELPLKLVFGRDCWARIQRKQRRLTLRHGPGLPTVVDPTELTLYRDFTTDVPFLALAENARLCGVTPRLCALCPGTSLSMRSVQCDFERGQHALNQTMSDDPTEW